MIIDANLGVLENLNNIFFLEFDLTNGNNDNNLDLRSLNDECVDKEIFFDLNGKIHDVQIFKRDLLFSVEYRKFIKSIQFRLKNFKNNIYDDKRKNWKRKKNNNIKGNLTFYAKILSNINIGIEFTRPFQEDYEIFHTNFNSVVNSYIKINKIYLELCIPKMFINNNINLSLFLNNDDKLEKEKNDGATSDTSNQSNKITSPLIIDNNENNDSKSNNMNNKLPSPPKLTYQNDFERMLYNQHNSPPSIRNKFSLGKYIKYNYYNSPNIYNNNNSPNSMGNFVQNNINSPRINSPIIFTPLSPIMQNPYLINFSNLQNNNNGQRKFCDNIYEKLKENPLSKMNPINYNNNSQTPVIMRVNNDEIIRAIPVQPFISSKEININNNSNNNNNNNFYSMTPMIQTIHKRILDWENKNNNTNNINLNINNKSYFNNITLNNIQIKNGLKNEFLNFFDGKNNLEIFINSITPFISKEESNNFFKIKLMTYFNFFKCISIFELRNTYYLYGYLININYSITLDSINLIISNQNIIQQMIDFLISINKIKTKEEIKENKDIIISDLIPNLMVRFYSNKMIILFIGNKPWHSRQIFINEIKEIAKKIPILEEIKLEDIDNESYFSTLYHPTKANRPYMTFTSFIVYYRFNKEIVLNNDKYEKNSIMGILPIKFDPKLYLTKISISGFLTIPIPPFMPFMTNYNNNDTILLNNLINGVMDNLRNIKYTSFDYDYYLKTSNYNQNFK